MEKMPYRPELDTHQDLGTHMVTTQIAQMVTTATTHGEDIAPLSRALFLTH